MIRRDVRLADGSNGWVLISQIEHARISAHLGQRCTRIADAARSDPGTRDEALAAIRHHDDGWLAWERQPQFDGASGRPLAFHELALDDAWPIWARSIDAAAAIGPLAAWMVAGHFLRLAAHSDEATTDRSFLLWRNEVERRREAWLEDWQRSGPTCRTRELAAEALQWLWTFDEISLWLCCSCSSVERSIPCAPEPYLAGRGTPLETMLQAVGPGVATATPWPFDAESISVVGQGQIIPARQYGNSAELLAAAIPEEFRWRLESPSNPAETPAKSRS